MAITIDSFAKQYIGLARTRGLTPRNPITFLFRPNANDQTEVYRVIVSLTEPSFSDTPYNVIWIDANSGSPQYQFVLLRTSHITDGNHRSSWATVTDYDNLFKSKQIYRFVVENASDLGIETGDVVIPTANTSRLGSVILKDDPTDPANVVVVSSSDPRMSNARYPTAHDHDDYPRTIIRLNDKAFVEVGTSTAPADGMVLAIVDRDPADVNKYIGRWVKPSANNVDWNSPHLLNLRISLPGDASFISDNTEIQMVSTAEFEDRVVQNPVGAIWSIEENAVGVTISETGLLHAPDLATDLVVKVYAKLKDPVYGNWVYASYDLHIRNRFIPDDPMVSLAIVGDAVLYATQRTTYSIVARYQSGASQAVTPNNFTSANDQLLSLNGLQATAGTSRVDTVVRLTATYITNGQTYTATKDVTVKAQVMTLLEIIGASSIASELSESYTFRITWSNGNTEMITPDSFLAAPTQYTVISGNRVTAKKEEVADRAVELQANYTQNGQTISGRKAITIVHAVQVPVLTSLAIQGSTALQENTSANYVFIATMSDGTTRNVNPLTFTADKPQVVSIVNKTVNAGSIEVDTAVKLSASYTLDGITKLATLDIMILNVIPVVNLTRIQIIGANSVEQNTHSDYTVLATYSDTSTRVITPDEFKLMAASQYATFADGRLTVGEVNIPSANVTLVASYTENSITKTANLVVTLVGSAIVPLSLEIIGADFVNEEASSLYAAQYVMSDGSRVAATGVVWSVIQGQAFATIATTGRLTAGTVTQDQITLIRAVSQGLTADKSVTIKNVITIVLDSVSSAAPGFVYGDPANKELPIVSTLTFTDGSTRLATASEITITLGVLYAEWFTLVPPSGSLGWRLRTVKALSNYYGNLNITFGTVATVNSVVKTSSTTFVVNGLVDEAVRAIIEGPATVDELTVNTYRVRIEMMSGILVNPTANVGTWSLPVGGAYATLEATETYNTKLTAKNVTGNQTITLSVANVMYLGQPYSATKSIVIADTGLHPTSVTLVGPTELSSGQSGTYTVLFKFSDQADMTATPVLSAKTAINYVTFSGDVATAGSVSSDQTFIMVGTCTVGGVQYKPELSVKVLANQILPESLTIVGPASVIGGVNTSYRATASLSDATTPDVTTSAVWTVAVKSGTVTATIPGGLLTTNSVTADAVVTITATYTLNGVQVTATKDVTVKKEDSAGEYTPRFGTLTKVMGLSGYNAAFMESMTTILTTTGEQFVTCPANASTDANGKFFYVAWPKRLGYGYFRDYTTGSYGFAGSWDGAQEFDDFNFVGCAEVTINGIDYVIWRNDFPFGVNRYVYSIIYGSSDPTSGRP